MNLPELYAKVVAARPEAKVPGSFSPPNNPDYPETWGIGGYFQGQHVARALIVDHWLGMLPDGHALRNGDGKWTVYENYYDDTEYAPTPLEALANFLLAEVKG